MRVEPGNEALESLRLLDLAVEDVRDLELDGARMLLGRAQALAILQVARELRTLVEQAEALLDELRRQGER